VRIGAGASAIIPTRVGVSPLVGQVANLSHELSSRAWGQLAPALPSLYPPSTIARTRPRIAPGAFRRYNARLRGRRKRAAPVDGNGLVEGDCHTVRGSREQRHRCASRTRKRPGVGPGRAVLGRSSCCLHPTSPINQEAPMNSRQPAIKHIPARMDSATGSAKAERAPIAIQGRHQAQ
jgi:hypothetical protein